MTINFEIFKKVLPLKLSQLSKNMLGNLPIESVLFIVENYIQKMSENRRLNEYELKLVISFYTQVGLEQRNIINSYFARNLGDNGSEDFIVLEVFEELHPVQFISILLRNSFIDNKLNTNQKDSFSILIENKMPSLNSKDKEIIPFIDDLSISHRVAYSSGQKKYAKPYLKEGHFGLYFESKFDQLKEFCIKLEYDTPEAIAHFLDKQAGRLLLEDLNGVKAKIKNESLGYFKYMQYIQGSQLLSIDFPNYIKLKEILSNLNLAIKVLTDKEPKRGEFWNSTLELVDGIEIQTSSSSSSYDVGVAFYIGKYVICDFGPTGNAMYVYDKNNFNNNIKHLRDWKQKDYTINSLQNIILNNRSQNRAQMAKGTLNHVGSWEQDVKELIQKAKL